MNHLTLFGEAAELLQHEWGGTTLPEVTSLDSLQAGVQAVVGHLWRHDRAKLWHCLYRMDVSEQAVNQLLAETGAEASIVAGLTQLIIDRSLQKAETRHQYRKWQQAQEQTDAERPTDGEVAEKW